MTKQVKIGELGQEIKTYALEDDETCQDLASRAGISTEGKSFRVEGETVDANHIPDDSDFVLVVKESKGG